MIIASYGITLSLNIGINSQQYNSRGETTMSSGLKDIWLENFKSYRVLQRINASDMSILLGANSSGKSSVLQALLLIKQTVECNSADINLLMSGKYVYLGGFQDILYDPSNLNVRIGVTLGSQIEHDGSADKQIFWTFTKSDNNEKIILKGIEITFNGEKIEFLFESDLLYTIVVSGNSTPWLTKIQNLKMDSYYAKFESNLNAIYCSFLNNLITEITGTAKIETLRKDRMVSYYGENSFYYILLNQSRKNKSIADPSNDENLDISTVDATVDSILSLIAQFRQSQLPSSSFLNEVVPDGMKKMIIARAVIEYIKRDNNFDSIKKIVSQYAKELEDYNRVPDSDKEYMVEQIMLDQAQDSTKAEDPYYDKLAEALTTYNGFMSDVIDKLFYLGPIREKPQGLYNIGFESIPKYVGVTGAYFASVLLNEKDKSHRYVIPDGVEETELLSAVDLWANHLNIASQIDVNKDVSFGYSVSIHNTQNKEASIMNVGIGTSQVLPVLICGLVSEPGETLLFEQPELHLHPFSQSRLADFFVALALNGRKIIVETHSEYMILRLRYHVLSGHIKPNQIAVNFFENHDGTTVKEGKLDVYGNLQYPSDFKDETQKLLDELLNAAMKKGHTYGKKHSD